MNESRHTTIFAVCWYRGVISLIWVSRVTYEWIIRMWMILIIFITSHTNASRHHVTYERILIICHIRMNHLITSHTNESPHHVTYERILITCQIRMNPHHVTYEWITSPHQHPQYPDTNESRHCGHCRYWCGDVTHSYLTHSYLTHSYRNTTKFLRQLYKRVVSNMNESRHRINICNVRNVLVSMSHFVKTNASFYAYE